MPISGSPEPDLLVDTSIAVALLVADHEHHEETVEAVGDRRLGLCGHAAFETFSVLTRLPPPNRRSPATIRRLLAANFPCSRFLSPEGATALLDRLASANLGGGMVYDALVGAAAVEYDCALASRDRRAIPAYALLGVDLQLVG